VSLSGGVNDSMRQAQAVRRYGTGRSLTGVMDRFKFSVNVQN
jgi:hypothetical protein